MWCQIKGLVMRKIIALLKIHLKKHMKIGHTVICETTELKISKKEIDYRAFFTVYRKICTKIQSYT